MTQETNTTEQPWGVVDEKDMEDFEIEKGEDFEEIKLPPIPVQFYPWGDHDPVRYKGEPTDMKQRLYHKIFNVWVLWLNLRIHKQLDGILQEETQDKESVEYQLKNLLVSIMDAMAKILVDTDLKQEILWLMDKDGLAPTAHDIQ